MKNPWKIHTSRSIYENPWIKIREDSVSHPNGKPGIYGVVEMKRIASGVLAMTDDEELYLVGQYRYPLDLYSWEIIEGGVEPGENVLDGIKRELKEEAGLEALYWERLGGDFHLSNCITNEVAQLFVARGLKQGTSQPDSSEELVIKKVPFVEVLTMVEEGEITDAMSVIGILMYDRLKRK